MDWRGPRQHPTAGGPLSLLCGAPEGSFLLHLSCGKAVVTATSVPTRTPGRGEAGGQGVLPGPAPHPTTSRQNCHCPCPTGLAFEVRPAGSRPLPGVVQEELMGRGKGLGAGAGRRRTLPSARSFSRPHWAPARFVILGPGVLLGGGVAPALSEAPSLPPPPREDAGELVSRAGMSHGAVTGR